jgi:hypothetical protein
MIYKANSNLGRVFKLGVYLDPVIGVYLDPVIGVYLEPVIGVYLEPVIDRNDIILKFFIVCSINRKGHFNIYR